MSGPAILSLLWKKNSHVLEMYARRHPGTVVIAPQAGMDAETVGRIEAAGATYSPLERYLLPTTISATKATAASRSESLRALLRTPTWSGYCAARDWNAATLASLGCEQSGQELEKGMLTIAALDQAHDKVGIGLVIVNEDLMPHARAVVAWAKARRVPSLCLSHSLILFEPYTVHGRIHADLLAVFGERALESYADAGLDATRIRVTGNPAWDSYPALRSRRPEFRELLSARHGLDARAPWVVFGTTWAANLTALGDEAAYGKMLEAFVLACKALFERNLAFQPVIKDRPQNAVFGAGRLRAICSAHEVAVERFLHVFDDPQAWVLAADALISVDSNLSVEAMLAGTPAINISNPTGVALGPPFDADSGILDVAPEKLAAVLAHLLGNPEAARMQVAAMDRAAPRYNCGSDAQATQRVVELMTQMAGLPAAAQYPWQTLLDVENTEANQYHNWPRTPLFELFGHPPRRVLDIGCGAGATGQALKQAYPDVEVFGIEVNRAAAEVARTRMDGVFVGKFEDIDLEVAGIAPGSLDTVIVADVLEHIYDPWHVLVRLKKYLSPDGQVIASIPNTRNLVVMEELAKGNWRYEPWGLLDITHIRFFTLREIHRFFHETGYRVDQVRYNLDHRLADLYQKHRNEKTFNIEFERMTLKNLTPDELGELCSIQFFIRAVPGSVANEQYEQLVGEKTPDYSVWQMARRLTAQEGDLWEERLRTWTHAPRVHLALLVPETAMSWIEPSLQSLTDQYYFNVAVSIVAQGAAPPGWHDSANLSWRTGRDDLLAVANQVLMDAEADWVGIVDAGDRVEPFAFLFLLEAAYSHPQWQVIYSDEDTLAENGERRNPHFKPDFNPDLLRSYPYTGGIALLQRQLFSSLGGFDVAMSGVEEHDLMLRAYEQVDVAGIGHVAEILLHRREGGGHALHSLPHLTEAAGRSLTNHLHRLNVAAVVSDGYLPLCRRIVYQHPANAPVSIVVVARDNADLLQRCIESIIARGGYPDFELLIVDANSQVEQTRSFMAGLEALGDERIKIFRMAADASLAQLHNLLAKQASGEYLLFMHFDTAGIEDDWLAQLMAQGQRPEIGVVAPRLLGLNGTVQRAGLILGMGGGVESGFSGLRLDDPGYFGRALLDQNVSAVGGGAFLTRREVFAKLGGFDGGLGVDAAEVDYCLRLTDSGLRVLWTPHVGLLWEGKAASIQWGAEADTPIAEALQPRWINRLAKDPAYNPNLRRAPGAAFTLETATALNWNPLPWRPLPKIMAHYADNVGSGQYRILGPMRALVEGKKVQGWAEVNLYAPINIAALELDSVVFQRQTTDEQISILESHRRVTKAFKVFELDDLLFDLPSRSIHRTHMPEDIAERLSKVVPLCDRLVVSTEPLAEAYRRLNRDIRVVKNYIERSRWGTLRPQRRQSQKPRVGWVGGIGHSGDLEMITDVVKELAAEVDWVFMGMCPESLRAYICEYHNGIPFDRYPAKVASLNLDLALAPLEINRFNEAKSHLRILEYGILGYPVICSDIYPYQGDFPVERVRNRTTDWVKAIRSHVADLDAAALRGDALRSVIERDWILEDHLDEWMAAWLP